MLYEVITNIRPAGQHAIFDKPGLSLSQAGIEKLRTNSVLAQRFNLVLHQGDQRRYDQPDAPANDRGNLVADGFADAGGHQDERIFSSEYFLDDFKLVLAKRIVSEIV